MKFTKAQVKACRELLKFIEKSSLVYIKAQRINDFSGRAFVTIGLGAGINEGFDKLFYYPVLYYDAAHVAMACAMVITLAEDK